MRRVTVDPPTKLRIAPKFGIDSAMNNRTSTENVLKAHLFQLKSKKTEVRKAHITLSPDQREC